MSEEEETQDILPRLQGESVAGKFLALEHQLLSPDLFMHQLLDSTLLTWIICGLKKKQLLLFQEKAKKLIRRKVTIILSKAHFNFFFPSWFFLSLLLSFLLSVFQKIFFSKKKTQKMKCKIWSLCWVLKCSHSKKRNSKFVTRCWCYLMLQSELICNIWVSNHHSVHLKVNTVL